MEKWKSFFQSSGFDIWTVIDRAITIAAIEQPAEMRLRRDRFTEKMFCPSSTTHLSECEDEVAGNNGGGSDDDVSETKFVVSDAAAAAAVAPAAATEEEDESDEEAEDEEAEEEEEEENEARTTKDSGYLDAEALSDEVEEESRRFKEINRIKNRIGDPDEEEEYLCEALERLEAMQMSIETLKATGIGKLVNHLRKHSSSAVSFIAARLLKEWKALTDQWSKSAQHLAAGVVSSPFDDDYGLPSPPVDEGELLAAGSVPVEVNKLFDFIEDDNISAGDGDLNDQPRRGSSGDWVNGIYEDAHSPENNKNNNSSKPSSRKANDSDSSRQKLSSKRELASSNLHRGKSSAEGKVDNNKSSSKLKQSDLDHGRGVTDSRQKSVPSNSARPKVPSSSGGLSNRPVASSGSKPKLQTTTPSANGFQKRSDDRFQSSKPKMNEQEDPERLAAAKRKLCEGYKQAENAKKQRTVRVMDLTELPKGKGGPKAVKGAPTKSHAQHNNRYMNHARR